MTRSSKKKTATNLKRAYAEGLQIIIKFPYNPSTVYDVKTLIGRKYNPNGKYWTAPIHHSNVRDLIDFGFLVDPKLIEETTVTKPLADTYLKKIEIPGLKRELYDYQSQGVSIINHLKGRALLADDMGLGKTLQSLAYLQLHPEIRPVIIICPASIKENWRREILKSLSGKPRIQILDGRTPTPIGPVDFIIINYHIVEAWLPELMKFNAKMIILDECHKIKNDSTKWTKAIKKLARKIPHILPLSGTIIESRPIEIFNAINLVNPVLFPNKMHFGKRYCDGKHNGFGWTFKGASNSQELHNILRDSMMIRRIKSDVLKDLPDKIKSFIPMPLNNRSEYEKIRNNFIEYVTANKGELAAERAADAEVLTQLGYLKQAAARGKLQGIIKWVEDFLESTDEKLVLFGIHKEMLQPLYEAFKTIAVKIDGSVPANKRQGLVDLFNDTDNIRLMIGNIDAAGVGLNMTSASKVAILELPWTPGALNQAIDRVHRIGQTKGVEVFFLLAIHTIEEELADMLDTKMKTIAAVIDGYDIPDQDLMRELISSIAV